MGRKLRLGLIAVAVPMVLTMNASWAKGCQINSQGYTRSNGACYKAPEINAGAGVGAIALLVGGLLLAAEKRRHSV